MGRELFVEHVVPSKYKGMNANKKFQDWVDSMLAGQAGVVAAAQKHLHDRDEKHLISKSEKEATAFPIGSYALVYKEANASDKLKMNWQGPFRVIKKESIATEKGVKEREDAFVLQCIGTGKIYSVSAHSMKPFSYRSEEDMQVVRQRDTNEWLVEKVLDHTGEPKQKSKMDFLVKWVGLDSSFNRWLPWKEMRLNVRLHEYLMKKGGEFAKLIPQDLEQMEL